MTTATDNTYRPRVGDHVRVTLEGRVVAADLPGFALAVAEEQQGVLLRDFWIGPHRRKAMNVTVEKIQPPTISLTDLVGARVRHHSGRTEYILGKNGILCVKGTEVGRWFEEGQNLELGWLQKYMSTDYYEVVEEPSK